MSIKSVPNLHLLRVTNKPWTSSKPSRIRIRSERFKQTVFIPWSDYDSPRKEENAKAFLESKGFNVVAIAEGENCMYILTDTFQPIN